MKSLPTEDWNMREIDKDSNIFTPHQTAYHTIHYICNLLMEKIDFNTRSRDIPRVNVNKIIDEMNEVISLFED